VTSTEHFLAAMQKPVEEIREAVKAIRDEWGVERGGAWNSVRDFHLAVADWLDREASMHEALGGVGNLLQSAADSLGVGELRIQFSEHADKMAASTLPQAVAVAHAYLGRTS
jgi:hypothetical protein